MIWVRFRKRDEHCRLERTSRVNGEVVERRTYNARGVPEVRKHAGFENMFLQVKAYQGMNKNQAEAAWQEYLKKEPSLARHLEMVREKRRQMNRRR